jgi:nucleoside-diphosphate-sugar epimerase
MMSDFKKILVTGGTGFVGYNLYQYLRRVEPDVDIWVYSRRTGADILNYPQLEAAIGGKDLVIHLAAQTHVDFSIDGSTKEKQQFVDTNTKGTLNVLMAARRHKVKLIHVSTSEVYGTSQHPGKPMTENHPLLAQSGVYGVSKAAADLLCRMAFMTEGQDVVVVRPFNMYGPHQSMEKLVPRFINMAMFGEPLTIYGDGEQRRDYIWVQDVADALWRARKLDAGTVINAGTEKSYSVNELAEMIIHACGSKGMKVHTQLSATRPGEVQELNGSYRRLNALTGWKPVVGIEEGIAKAVDWYSSNGYIVPPKILNDG